MKKRGSHHCEGIDLYTVESTLTLLYTELAHLLVYTLGGLYVKSITITKYKYGLYTGPPQDEG